MPTPFELIDRKDVLELFHEFMQLDGGCRFLCLSGVAKVGKSHFMTKVFPALARETYGARYAVVDLSPRSHAEADVLHNACAQLGGDSLFPRYHEAYEVFLSRPRVEVKGLQAILSSVLVRSQDEPTERERAARYLVSEFVADLETATDGPVLLLIDAVDKANERMQEWLMHTLMVQMARVPHARVVIAGRTVPEPAGSCVAISLGIDLPPVEDEEAYITYCREIEADLNEQEIRKIAFMFDYMPGYFVDFVRPKFGRVEVSRGF